MFLRPCYHTRTFLETLKSFKFKFQNSEFHQISLFLCVFFLSPSLSLPSCAWTSTVSAPQYTTVIQARVTFTWVPAAASGSPRWPVTDADNCCPWLGCIPLPSSLKTWINLCFQSYSPPPGPPADPSPVWPPTLFTSCRRASLSPGGSSVPPLLRVPAKSLLFPASFSSSSRSPHIFFFFASDKREVLSLFFCRNRRRSSRLTDALCTERKAKHHPTQSQLLMILNVLQLLLVMPARMKPVFNRMQHFRSDAHFWDALGLIFHVRCWLACRPPCFVPFQSFSKHGGCTHRARSLKPRAYKCFCKLKDLLIVQMQKEQLRK